MHFYYENTCRVILTAKFGLTCILYTRKHQNLGCDDQQILVPEGFWDTRGSNCSLVLFCIHTLSGWRPRASFIAGAGLQLSANLERKMSEYFLTGYLTDVLTLSNKGSFREYCFVSTSHTEYAHIVVAAFGEMHATPQHVYGPERDQRKNWIWSHRFFYARILYGESLNFPLQGLIGCLHLVILLHYLMFVMSRRQKSSPEKWVEVRLFWSVCNWITCSWASLNL